MRGWNYNLIRMFMWRVDPTTGISVGQLDPNSLGAAPVTSQALDVRGPISATLPAPTYARFESQGGGTYEGSATGGVEALGQLSIQLSQEDEALYTLARGGLKDTTTITGGPEIFSDNSLNPSPFDCGLMLVRRKQKMASPKSNVYQHILYPLGTMSFIKPNPTQEGGKNTQPLTLNFDPQVATLWPWGEAFGAAQGWFGNSEISALMEDIYPYAMTSFIADGVATTFLSAYKPAVNTVTAGRARNVTAKGGVPTALTSINTTSGLHTLAAPGTTGDKWVSFHPTQNYAPV